MHQLPVRHLCFAAASLVACGSGDRPYDSPTTVSTVSTDVCPSSSEGVAPIGSIDDCSVAPINPNATPQARNLLCYVYSIYGKAVLSGQQETSWKSPDDDVIWIRTTTGKCPAILGGDFLYPNGTTQRARAWWNAGGIPMLRYHMGAPPLADTYDNSKGKSDLGLVLTAGTAENESLNGKLDYVAGELLTLQKANVAVLWAPLHEAQPRGWFWWSKGTEAQFVELWKYFYDYLTNVKGVNNVIWLFPFSGSVSAAVYPGKDFVDLAGPDTYSKPPPFASLYTATANIVGTSIPIPLHETGVVPNPDTMFPAVAPWVLFNIWAGYQLDTSQNTVEGIRAAYASDYTITREEIADLR